MVGREANVEMRLISSIRVPQERVVEKGVPHTWFSYHIRVVSVFSVRLLFIDFGVTDYSYFLTYSAPVAPHFSATGAWKSSQSVFSTDFIVKLELYTCTRFSKAVRF